MVKFAKNLTNITIDNHLDLSLVNSGYALGNNNVSREVVHDVPGTMARRVNVFICCAVVTCRCFFPSNTI